MVRLYVGGLPPDITADVLSGRFKAFGEVVDCEIIYTKSNDPSGRGPGTCRGFAYLTLEPKDDASLSRCLSMYNGCKWKGYVLRLDKAKPHFTARLEQEWEDDSALELWEQQEREPQDMPLPVASDLAPLQLPAPPGHPKKVLKVEAAGGGKKLTYFPPAKSTAVFKLSWEEPPLPAAVKRRKLQQEQVQRWVEERAAVKAAARNDTQSDPEATEPLPSTSQEPQPALHKPDAAPAQTVAAPPVAKPQPRAQPPPAPLEEPEEPEEVVEFSDDELIHHRRQHQRALAQALSRFGSDSDSEDAAEDVGGDGGAARRQAYGSGVASGAKGDVAAGGVREPGPQGGSGTVADVDDDGSEGGSGASMGQEVEAFQKGFDDVQANKDAPTDLSLSVDESDGDEDKPQPASRAEVDEVSSTDVEQSDGDVDAEADGASASSDQVDDSHSNATFSGKAHTDDDAVASASREEDDNAASGSDAAVPDEAASTDTGATSSGGSSGNDGDIPGSSPSSDCGDQCIKATDNAASSLDKGDNEDGDAHEVLYASADAMDVDSPASSRQHASSAATSDDSQALDGDGGGDSDSKDSGTSGADDGDNGDSGLEPSPNQNNQRAGNEDDGALPEVVSTLKAGAEFKRHKSVQQLEREWQAKREELYQDFKSKRRSALRRSITKPWDGKPGRR